MLHNSHIFATFTILLPYAGHHIGLSSPIPIHAYTGTRAISLIRDIIEGAHKHFDALSRHLIDLKKVQYF